MFLSNTTVTKTYTTSDGSVCNSLKEAKTIELAKLLNEDPESPNIQTIIEHSDEVMAILRVKRGRRANAGAKPAKKKVARKRAKGNGETEQPTEA